MAMEILPPLNLEALAMVVAVKDRLGTIAEATNNYYGEYKLYILSRNYFVIFQFTDVVRSITSL